MLSLTSRGMVDYDSVIPFKQRLLEKAWANFKAGERMTGICGLAYDEFCARQGIGWKTTRCFER